MILEQTIQVNVTSNTKKYYENLGYKCKKGDTIQVNTKDLPRGSHVTEKRICDCCGQVYSRPHRAMEDTFESFGKDYCIKCFRENSNIKKLVQGKRENTNLEKYGAKTPCANEDIKNKVIKTNLDKYGVRSTLQLDEVKEKTKKSLLDRYGVDSPLKSDIIKDKVKNTCLEKYGVESPLKNELIKEKMFNTNIERYGVKSTAQVTEVREKMIKSLIENSSIPTSKSQIELFEIIKNMYPNNEVYLNYNLSRLFLDVVLFINNIKIDLEFDGEHWHKDKRKDFRRDCFVKDNGFKVIRIKSTIKNPTKEQLKEAIDILINSNKTFIEINLIDKNKE